MAGPGERIWVSSEGVLFGFPTGVVLGGSMSEEWGTVVAFVVATGFVFLASLIAYLLIPETSVEDDSRRPAKPWGRRHEPSRRDGRPRELSCPSRRFRFSRHYGLRVTIQLESSAGDLPPSSRPLTTGRHASARLRFKGLGTVRPVMPELDMPDDVDTEEATVLVREFADIGDRVELYHDVQNLETENRITGTIVDIKKEYLELDVGEPSNERLQPTNIDRMSLVAE